MASTGNAEDTDRGEELSARSGGSRNSSNTLIGEDGEEDAEYSEKYEEAVFTATAFAVVIAVYCCIVYSLSSPPSHLSSLSYH
ncbi:uncharacterized protein LOC111673997 isoform X2 [Orussus abietinus]|uniref:uncharacterized protein LOC111673997 isoform X2 n=1 Tax=Orussus abietinus TaxID=222816 RepID=UPI000C715F6A|nr:uncharacterized protein LOC111673997 isoform X2 [Orussus abietinus]